MSHIILQSIVSRPVQRPVIVAGAASTRGLQTVYGVTLRGPILPQAADALLALAQRTFGPAVASALTVQTEIDPQHAFAEALYS